MKLLTVAGEVSGDTHGGALLGHLQAFHPQLEVYGIGGSRMQAAGLQPLFPLATLQVHGLLEIVRHLPRLYRTLWALEAWMDAERPDAVLTIDYPGFNLKLAAAARKRGIPAIHYSSPSIWAWRGGRIRTIARAVDLMLLLFPFEQPLYDAAGVPAVFLGHPLVGLRASEADVAALRRRLGEDGRPVVAVMPGSRPSELQRNLPPLLEGLALIRASGYEARFVIPVAPSLRVADVEAMVQAHGVAAEVLEQAFLPLLDVADLALVASGTATLQVAMAGVPMVVVYRVAPLSFWLAQRLAYIRHFSIVNILAGREVVPELLQDDFTPERLRDTFLAMARDPARRAAVRGELLDVTASLGEPGAYQRAAEHIADFIAQRHSAS